MKLHVRKTFKTGGSLAIRIPSDFQLKEHEELEFSMSDEGFFVMKRIGNLDDSLRELALSNENNGDWDDTTIERSTEPSPPVNW